MQHDFRSEKASDKLPSHSNRLRYNSNLEFAPEQLIAPRRQRQQKQFLIRMRNSVIFRLSNWKVGVRWASGLAEASKPVKQRGCHSRMSGWQIHAYSDNVQELQLSENVRKPFIRKPTELLVKVSASSVNPFDVAVMSERCQSPESHK